jgi:hypothetical protein
MKANHAGDENKYAGDEDKHVGDENEYVGDENKHVGDEDKLLYVFSGNADESELIIYINSLIINVMACFSSMSPKLSRRGSERAKLS